MSEWTSRVESHPIQNTLSNYESKINEIENEELITSQSIDDFERIKKIIRLLRNNLTQDPILLTPAPLNNLNNTLQNSLNELTNFRSNQNSSHLKNANTHLDSLLIHLAQISFQSSFSISDFSETLVSFRRSAGQYAHYIEEEFNKLKASYESLNKEFIDFKAQINSQKTRLDTAISNFQTQFSEAETKRSETFNNSEIKRTEKFDASITNQKEKFEDKLNGQVESFENALDTFKKQSEENLESISSNTKSLVENLVEKKNEAEKLVNVIANVGMAGGYQKVANEARKAKLIWQVATTIALTGLIAFAIIAFISAVSGEFNLGKFGARIFAAISFGIFAAYSAREAEKSSNREALNRQLELELASIDLYLAKLPEDKQISIKTELASKWFGNLHKTEKEAKDNFNGNSYELLKMIINNLSKLK
jgi:hypothetical protein